jgi:Type II secretion system (T2SS), protein F/ClpX C4-type zinc finger
MTQVDPLGAITAGELATFCRQIGVMLTAGVDLLRALHVAAEQTPSQRLKAVAQQVRDDLEDGRLMAAALMRYPDLFSPFFISLVRQGEREGVLAQVMTSMADYLDRERLGISAVSPGGGAGGQDVVEVIERLKPLIFWQMVTMGIIALGIAALWWASLGGLLTEETVGPNVALWVGVCILASALIFHTFRPVRIAHCSFCGRPESAAGAGLVQGPGVAICPDCLRSHVDQMKQVSRREEKVEALATAEEEIESHGSRSSAPSHLANGTGVVDDDDPPGEGEIKRIEI